MQERPMETVDDLMGTFDPRVGRIGESMRIDWFLHVFTLPLGLDAVGLRTKIPSVPSQAIHTLGKRPWMHPLHQASWNWTHRGNISGKTRHRLNPPLLSCLPLNMFGEHSPYTSTQSLSRRRVICCLSLFTSEWLAAWPFPQLIPGMPMFHPCMAKKDDSTFTSCPSG